MPVARYEDLTCHRLRAKTVHDKLNMGARDYEISSALSFTEDKGTVWVIAETNI